MLLRCGKNRHEEQGQTPSAAEATFVAHLQAAMSMQEQVHLIKGGLEMLYLNVVVAMLSE